jgi:non-heme chloroperoxidase
MSLAAAAQQAKVTEGRFTTNDGTVLDYLEAGSGQPLVMVPGCGRKAPPLSSTS